LNTALKYRNNITHLLGLNIENNKKEIILGTIIYDLDYSLLINNIEKYTSVTIEESN